MIESSTPIPAFLIPTTNADDPAPGLTPRELGSRTRFPCRVGYSCRTTPLAQEYWSVFSEYPCPELEVEGEMTAPLDSEIESITEQISAYMQVITTHILTDN